MPLAGSDRDIVAAAVHNYVAYINTGDDSFLTRMGDDTFYDDHIVAFSSLHNEIDGLITTGLIVEGGFYVDVESVSVSQQDAGSTTYDFAATAGFILPDEEGYDRQGASGSVTVQQSDTAVSLFSISTDNDSWLIENFSYSETRS